MRKQLYAFWKFTRPHTVVGTTLSVLALYAMADADSPASCVLIPPLLLALASCWLGNVYIVGLNQLQDVAIDRINKPYLPLASGEFSLGTGRLIVIISGVLSLLFSVLGGRFLFLVLAISLLIGTLYSLPPFRLKRFPFWASFSVLSVRGLVVNLGLFLYFTQELAGEAYLTPEVWALTLFMVVFSLGIAWFKDLPDVEGDRKFGIGTFVIRLGPGVVLRSGLGLLMVTYMAMILIGLLGNLHAQQALLVLFHGLAAGLLWRKSRTIRWNERTTVTQFYQFIWKLFYLEYLVFPMAVIFYGVF